VVAVFIQICCCGYCRFAFDAAAAWLSPPFPAIVLLTPLLLLLVVVSITVADCRLLSCSHSILSNAAVTTCFCCHLCCCCTVVLKTSCCSCHLPFLLQSFLLPLLPCLCVAAAAVALSSLCDCQCFLGAPFFCFLNRYLPMPHLCCCHRNHCWLIATLFESFAFRLLCFRCYCSCCATADATSTVRCLMVAVSLPHPGHLPVLPL